MKIRSVFYDQYDQLWPSVEQHVYEEIHGTKMPSNYRHLSAEQKLEIKKRTEELCDKIHSKFHTGEIEVEFDLEAMTGRVVAKDEK